MCSSPSSPQSCSSRAPPPGRRRTNQRPHRSRPRWRRRRAPPAPAPRAVDRELAGPQRRAGRRPPAPAPDGSPVVRAQAGNLGFFFKLGGLATLDHNNTSRNVNALGFTQVGLKFVSSEKLLVRAYFGTGLQHSKAESCPEFGTCTSATSTDMGIEAGVDLEYHFRIWRRISPFVGAGLGTRLHQPLGRQQLERGRGLRAAHRRGVLPRRPPEPDGGVHAHHRGRLPEGEHRRGRASTTTFAYRTLAGGALVVTYYF